MKRVVAGIDFTDENREPDMDWCTERAQDMVMQLLCEASYKKYWDVHAPGFSPEEREAIRRKIWEYRGIVGDAIGRPGGTSQNLDCMTEHIQLLKKGTVYS